MIFSRSPPNKRRARSPDRDNITRESPASPPPSKRNLGSPDRKSYTPENSPQKRPETAVRFSKLLRFF